MAPPSIQVRSDGQQRAAIANLFARNRYGGEVRLSMTRARQEWVTETLETPSWAVSLEGQTIQPRPAEERQVAPTRRVRSPTERLDTDGARPARAPAPPRTLTPGKRWVRPVTPRWVPVFGGSGQPLLAHPPVAVEPEPEICAAVKRVADAGPVGLLERPYLEPPTWPPPLPSAPEAADVAQQWQITSGPVLPSPRAGVCCSVPGFHRPSTIHGAGQSVEWVAADPRQSLHTTWSSLPPKEHSRDEIWASQLNPSSTPAPRHTGVIQDSLNGQQACMFPHEQRSERQYGGRLRTPRSARYPTPPTRRRNVDKAKISMTARKMERGGALEVSRRAASTAYSTHPLINPAPVSLMDRMAANMFLTKHRDDLAAWQIVQLDPGAAAS